ncbi:hypothetical protein CCH79_00017236 [Gambusia affinis]|uniref:Uncharacterized protein n=1 Tax=Gambusia affinis TaxID=33528 RepID=A0A315WDN5_GAMAF|nr:hypothetical protein CCH79_00017236 [Gambusia affinis]
MARRSVVLWMLGAVLLSGLLCTETDPSRDLADSDPLSFRKHSVLIRRKRSLLFPSGVKLCSQETFDQVVSNHLNFFHLRGTVLVGSPESWSQWVSQVSTTTVFILEEELHPDLLEKINESATNWEGSEGEPGVLPVLLSFNQRVEGQLRETVWEAFKIFWDRLPDRDEYQDWVNRCIDGSVSIKDIGSFFSQSEEHQSLIKTVSYLTFDLLDVLYH